MTPQLLAKLCKGNSAITYTNPMLSVFNLSNCNIKEDSSTILTVLLSNPNVKAIDLSYNLLSSAFESYLIDTLKARKATPQYIFLHGIIIIINFSNLIIIIIIITIIR